MQTMGKNRIRNNRIYFHLDDGEKNMLDKKMKSVGIKNRDAFVRKMVLDGYIIQVDTKPTADLNRLIKNATTNINQVAKRCNETGNVLEKDVLELLAECNRLIPLAVEAHRKVAELSKY